MAPTESMPGMTRKSITLKDNAPAPLGCYSHAYQAGPFLFLCGLGARDGATGTEMGVTVNANGQVVSYDIELQTHAVIHNMITVLEAAGCTLMDVVDVQVFLADMKDFHRYNLVYAEYFAFENPPARTTIEARPPGHNFIEIKAVALVPQVQEA